MYRITEYDLFAEKYGIIDKETFISNIKKLYNADSNYKELYSELINMYNNNIDIPENLEQDVLIEMLETYYGCGNSLTIEYVYNIIIQEFRYKIDSKACTANLKPVYDSIYKAYKSDYKLFIRCIHKVIKEPGRYSINNFNRKNIEINVEPNKNYTIPPVPTLATLEV